MDEQHWLLGTTLAGFVFEAVFFSFVWLLTSQPPGIIAGELLMPLNITAGVSETLAVLVVVGASFAVIGMLVRVVSVVAWFYSHLNDQARALVGQLSRQALKRTVCETMTQSRNKVIREIEDAADDSLFIWFVLAKKKRILVEWARNRRHYQYLGENCFTATCAALLLAVPAACWHGFHSAHPLYIVLYGFFVILWLGVLVFLRTKMKRAVDSMELAWVCERIDPKVRDRVLNIGSVQNVKLPLTPWQRIWRRNERCKS